MYVLNVLVPGSIIDTAGPEIRDDPAPGSSEACANEDGAMVCALPTLQAWSPPEIFSSSATMIFDILQSSKHE